MRDTIGGIKLNRKLPSDDELRRLYVECELSERAIAERFSVNRGTVVGRMRRAGITPRIHRKSPPDEVLIRLLSDPTKTRKQLKTELGISISTLSAHVTRLGMGRRIRKLDDDQKVRELYLEKKLCGKEIAKEMDTSPTTVHRHISKLGIGRSFSEAQQNYFSRTPKRPTYNGYILTKKAPTNPRARADGYLFEHVLVAEKKLGRPLRKEEIVHHIDHVKGNNAPSNLYIFSSKRDHMNCHRSLEIAGIQQLHRGQIVFKDGLYYAKDDDASSTIASMGTSKPKILSLETWSRKVEGESEVETK